MKIGIITFWESTDNYGQVLQAYALQSVLKDIGHEPFQIRYSLKASQLQQYKSSIFKKIIKILLVYPIFVSYRRKKEKTRDAVYHSLIEEKNKARRFPEFRNQYISHSKKIFNSIEELRADPPQADCYITGSDQVWTMLLNNEGNNAYYLDFGNPGTKRIAYAASFGRAVYPKELRPLLKELLSKFHAISVREFEGVEICKSLGVRAEHVIDPTLLLDSKEYLGKFCTSIPKSKKTLFVYSINVRTQEDIYWSELTKYADSNKMNVIVTTSSGNISGREIYPDVKYSYATIEQWLSQIANAELVATTSFHGVVFCLLMHTNFVFYPLKGKDTKSNGRVQSLLESVGVSDKTCYNQKDLHRCILKQLDWNRIDERINALRNMSLNFLKHNLL